MPLISGTVTATNGSDTFVATADADWSEVQPGDLLKIADSTKLFDVQRVFKGSGIWRVNTTNKYTGASGSKSYTISNGFTPEHSIPYPEIGDIPSTSTLKRAMMKFDDLLAYGATPAGIMGTQSGKILTRQDGEIITKQT